MGLLSPRVKVADLDPDPSGSQPQPKGEQKSSPFGFYRKWYTDLIVSVTILLHLTLQFRILWMLSCYRKYLWVVQLFIIALYSFSYGQGDDENGLIASGNNWKEKLELLQEEDLIISVRDVKPSDVLKARSKLSDALSEAIHDFEANGGDEDMSNDLQLMTTNSSLWYAEITTEDFQVFLRRLVTGRPISKDVIQDLKRVYIKWLLNPTLKNLQRYSQKLLETGRSYEILTKLHVSTGGSNPVTIKYRPLLIEEAQELIGPVAEKSIPVGNYYVWLEKDGEILTDVSLAFPCIRSTKRIVLADNK